MIDRKIGYAILAGLTAVLVGTLAYAIHLFLFPPQHRIIVFEHVGNLAIEDPVCCRGLTIGTVRKMEGVGTHAVVTVELTKPIALYRDYEIVTLDKGIMGDRVVTFYPGDDTGFVVPPGDTLHGTFFIGVSEVLGMAWKLEGGVRALVAVAQRLLSGTEDSPSLVEQFQDIAFAIDTLSLRVASASAALDVELGGQLRALNTAVASARRVTKDVAVKAPGMVKSVEEQIDDLNRFVVKIDDLLKGLDEIVVRMRQGDNILWGDLAADIAANLAEIRRLADDVQEGAAKLRLVISRLKED